MAGEKTYQSTKFAMLYADESILRRKKRRLILIFIVTLTVVIAVFCACFHYYPFFESQYQKENQAASDFFFSGNFTATDSPEDYLLKIFSNKNRILVGNKEASKHFSEVLCDKPEELTIGIPLGNRIHPLNVADFVTMDLHLYYKRIIHELDFRRLRLLFEDYDKKLSEAGEFKTFLNFLKYLKCEKLKFYAGYLNKLNFKWEANDFKYVFDLTHELHLWYIYLDALYGFLLNYEQQKHRESYNMEITEHNFGKFTRKTQEILFRFPNTFNVTGQKLKEINEIITELTSPVNVIINGTSVTVFGKVLLSSQIKALNTSFVKNVYAFATHTIYLDEGLTFPGVNVAIIAPRWVFLKKVKINLSGRVGEKYKSETAEDKKVGEPGNPGENGGDFLGVGNMNEKFLTITADGGRGGKGQNGASGRDGVNNTSPGPPIKKPSCVFKMCTFKNSFGQVLTHYKIYNEDGCGGSGMDGGAGGEGGKGGNVIFINGQLNITQGSNGMRGVAGKGGKGGAGGRNGCFFEVWDVDDEILHKITTVKCPTGNLLPSGNPGKDDRNTKGQLHPLKKVNLSVSDSLFSFLKLAGSDFSQFNDSIILEFIGQLNLDVLFYNVSNLQETDENFKIIEKLNKLEFYQVLQNKIDNRLRVSEKNHSIFGCLRTLVLGKMLTLKGNTNYMFMDFDDYLNTIEKNIENINEGALATYSASVLHEKVGSKLGKIRESLDAIKTKLANLGEANEKLINKFLASSLSKDNQILARALQERRLLFSALTVVDFMMSFVAMAQGPLRSKEKLKLKNLLLRDILSYGNRQRKKEEFFAGLSNLSSSQKRTVSEIALSAGEYEEYPEIFTKVAELIGSLPQEDGIMRILENFYMRNPPESGNLVGKVKQIVESLSTESEVVSAEEKILLKDLTDELDHLMVVYYLVERRELEKLFLNSLNDWKFNGGEEEIKFFKSRLREVIIILEYNLAVDATEAKLYPSRTLNRQLQPTRNIADKAVAQINHLRKINREIPICMDIQEAIFDKESAVGEFYLWKNSEISSRLKDLFKGAEIKLKSDLNNRHVLDKNFVKFKSVKMELECTNSSFRQILDDFQMKITHSGYSYYNWKGKREIRVSEEVTFNYGFKIRENGEPELYSVLFKKFQSGDISLSPYTTWTLRLLPINGAADYDKLTRFSDIVDVRLVGIGTFIS